MSNPYSPVSCTVTDDTFSNLMMPKFSDVATWQQAEQLMQPAFIRLVDNLRKQLEQSPWKGTYEDVQLWAEDVSNDVRLQVTQLQAALQSARLSRRIKQTIK